jgi:hypothetical protein
MAAGVNGRGHQRTAVDSNSSNRVSSGWVRTRADIPMSPSTEEVMGKTMSSGSP